MFNLKHFLASLFAPVRCLIEEGHNDPAHRYCEAMIDSLPSLNGIGHVTTSQELRTALSASSSCSTVVEVADMGGDWRALLETVEAKYMVESEKLRVEWLENNVDMAPRCPDAGHYLPSWGDPCDECPR